MLDRLQEGQFVLYSAETMMQDRERIGNLGSVVGIEPHVWLDPVMRLYDRGQGLESEEASGIDLTYVCLTGKDFKLQSGDRRRMKEYLQDQGYRSHAIDEVLQCFQPAATD